jgi:hypothetical protein
VKILVLICSCNTEKSRKLREACRETWLKHQIPNIYHVFVVAGENPESDVISVDGEDTYNALPGKMRRAYENILRNYDFDHVFKCDDDTYVQLDRLAKIVSHDFGGNEFILGEGRFASGGAGYFMSRELLVKVLEEDIPEYGPEDVIFSQVALRYADTVWSSKLLGYSPKIFPNISNQQITAHWISHKRMKFIHDTFTQKPYAIAKTRHLHWEDELIFYEKTFTRKNHPDFGEWKIVDDNLHLMWDMWPEEIVTKSDDGYSNDILTISDFRDI